MEITLGSGISSPNVFNLLLITIAEDILVHLVVSCLIQTAWNEKYISKPQPKLLIWEQIKAEILGSGLFSCSKKVHRAYKRLQFQMHFETFSVRQALIGLWAKRSEFAWIVRREASTVLVLNDIKSLTCIFRWFTAGLMSDVGFLYESRLQNGGRVPFHVDGG